MRHRTFALLSLALASVSCARSASHRDDSTSARAASGDTSAAVAAAPAATSDSAYSALQARGAAVMGVDQYTSAHVFESLSDGGRIVLDRDAASDTAGIRTIRAHMREISAAFQRGDFAAPGLVHSREVPGTRVMAARAGSIRYAAADRPRGGEVRITTRDPEALRAVHEFLAFQRADHRAAGHEGMRHGEGGH